MTLNEQMFEALAEVTDQIREVEKEAAAMNIPAYKMRDATGSWVLTPLLLAKAHLLDAISRRISGTVTS